MRYVTAYDPDTNDEIRIAAKWEICPTCDGEGTNSLHLGAFSSANDDDMEWLAENGEAYFAGAFDQRCECEGGRVLVVDPTDPNYRIWEGEQEAAAWIAAERAAELRAGC